MGIDKDPIAAARKAVLNMVEELKSKGLSGEEAYILCSVVGSLKMSEVVDEPNYVVSFSIPEKIININA
jgi:Predicted acetamidase/formamidase